MGTNAIKGKNINRTFEDEKLYCPFCISELRVCDDNIFYCTNEMCLCEMEFDEFGNQIKD